MDSQTEQQPKPQPRARAPIPPTTELDALRALYTRVHWVVIADIENVIAQGEKDLQEHQAEVGQAHMYDMLQRCTAALRERVSDYNSDYAHYIKQTDERSLQTMQRFIRNVADREAGKKDLNPMFAFLFQCQ